MLWDRFQNESECSIDPFVRFPAQEHVGGDSKIPTIIYYDQAGVVRAVGAEAIGEGVKEEAEENDWIKAEWWILFKSKVSAHLNRLSVTGSSFTSALSCRLLRLSTKRLLRYPLGNPLWAFSLTSCTISTSVLANTLRKRTQTEPIYGVVLRRTPNLFSVTRMGGRVANKPRCVSPPLGPVLFQTLTKAVLTSPSSLKAKLAWIIASRVAWLQRRYRFVKSRVATFILNCSWF